MTREGGEGGWTAGGGGRARFCVETAEVMPLNGASFLVLRLFDVLYVCLLVCARFFSSVLNNPV